MAAGLAVDHPGGVPYRLGEYPMRKFPARQGNKSGPEYVRQSAYRHKIILSSLNPVSFVAGKAPCRDEAVDMGMVDQCPRPGMKDGKHADLSSHVAIV